MSVVMWENKGQGIWNWGQLQYTKWRDYRIPGPCFTHRRGLARWGSHVAHLNFKTSRVGVYKCLSLICLLCRHCRNLAEGGCLLSRFHFTCCCYFWAMSLVRICPSRASQNGNISWQWESARKGLNQTKHVFWCPVCCSVIGQAKCSIYACHPQLIFLFCC